MPNVNRRKAPLDELDELLNKVFAEGTGSQRMRHREKRVLEVLYHHCLANEQSSSTPRPLSANDVVATVIMEDKNAVIDDGDVRTAVRRLRQMLPVTGFDIPTGKRGYLLVRAKHRRPQEYAPREEAQKQFWGDVIGKATRRYIVFGNEYRRLKEYKSLIDAELSTGSGEVGGLFRLGYTFGLLGIGGFEIWDSANFCCGEETTKRMFILYVGSPISNSGLADVLKSAGAKFTILRDIHTKRPTGRTPRLLIKSADGFEYKYVDRGDRDYALLTYRRSGRKAVLCISGLSSYATWGVLTALQFPRLTHALISELGGAVKNVDALLLMKVDQRRPLAAAVDPPVTIEKAFVEGKPPAWQRRIVHS